MTIVIIDDDEEEIPFMKAAIEACHPEAHCLTFTSCEHAMSNLKSMVPPPDFVFLDVHMKKLDGEECLAEIKSNDRLNGAKIIMMSSSMLIYEKKQQRLIDKGAYAIAEKPVSMDEYGRMFEGFLRS